MVGFIVSAIKIIFVLGFLVLIHEGGHFLVAKFFKVYVNEFSIGFGKEYISSLYRSHDYSCADAEFRRVHREDPDSYRRDQ